MDTERLEQRMWKYIEPEPNSGCWLWIGYQTPRQYGRILVDGHSRFAHRIAYALWKGPLTPDLTIDHLCRVHSCVNPAHLELVTQRENVLRGNAKAALLAQQTHCQHGHPLEGEFIYRRKNRRICRVCCNAYHRVRYHRRRAAGLPR